MTRFARAKGSKSSNERVPNEATPWHVMKEQLEDSVMMKNNQTPKTKSAKELLSEKDQPFYYESTGNVNNEWAEFETSAAERQSTKKKKEIDDRRVADDVKKNKTLIKSAASVAEETTSKDLMENDATDVSRKSKKNKKRKSEVRDETGPAEDSKKNDEIESEPKKRIKNKKSKKTEFSEPDSTENSKPTENKEETRGSVVSEETNRTTEKYKNEAGGVKISKRHKRNQKRLNKKAMEKSTAEAEMNEKKAEAATFGGFDATGNDWNSNVNFGNPGKVDGSKESGDRDKRSTPNGSNKNLNNGPYNRLNNGTKRKAPKIRDDQEHKRRKPDTGSIKCIINGQEVEIVKYDGFPVKKEDAERLKDLRKKMVMKGIPKSEIDAAMKLERRKAEKALARMRKQVCFHCRKTGHNLSDCPELGEEESATGICFKCGSTEHTHFECKVTKKEEFRFASCFICREQGHIAKQCPDNPKGLYPQGGACKICGDVTHLKKDCPDLTREKEETTLTLGTIGENTVESLDDDSNRTIAKSENKKSKSKVVKF